MKAKKVDKISIIEKKDLKLTESRIIPPNSLEMQLKKVANDAENVRNESEWPLTSP